MDEPLPTSSPTEVQPPPLPTMWRKNASYLRAVPICRAHAIENKIKDLHPFAATQECQISKCEHYASYLAII